MKTLITIIALVACTVTAEASRSYQSIIDDLRAENRKGDEKAVELQKKIDAREKELLKAYGNLSKANEKLAEANATVKRLESAERKSFARLLGLGAGIGLVGVGWIIAKRSQNAKAPATPVSESPPHTADKPRPKRRSTTAKK